MAQYIGVNGVARKVTSPYIGLDGVARNVKNGYVGVDGVARSFFAPESNNPVVLEVEKITSNTYDGSTTFTNEEFLLLNVYPKSAGSIVNVTYGGLTKTITFSGINSVPVFFGTFNGVTDSIATPSSGTLTIEGDFKGFAVGTYSTYNTTTSKSSSEYCSCITDATDISGIQTLPSYAFYECSKITDVQIPKKITSIGSSAFYGCTNLALTSLPSGITSIGSSAFYGCTGLTEMNIPDGVTSIGSSAFENCSKLANVRFPKNITNIPSKAFYSCDALAITSLPNSIETIDDYAFRNCYKLSITSLPTSLTTIGNDAFFNCKGLLLSSLPSGVTTIGTRAFAMKDVALGTNIKMLGQTFTLPSGVTSIGDYAFGFQITNGGGGSTAYSCLYLATVKMSSATPPAIVGEPFGSVESNDYSYALTKLGKEFKIIVPSGCGNAYKTAENWSHYADYIVEAT